MKSRTFVLMTMTLFAALAMLLRLAAQERKLEEPQRYTVTDLGTLEGGVFSVGEGINNKGWVDGFAGVPSTTFAEHAFLWRKGVMKDLGTLGGPNSLAFSRPTERGEVAGFSDISTPDPLGEDFCGFLTNLICRPFLWQGGVLSPLPTLVGNNAEAGGINNRGEVVGVAENATTDPTCMPPKFPEFRPVLWERDDIEELPTFGGDPDGTANTISDNGQVVGGSGNCMAFHALLWQRRDEEESKNEDSDHWILTNLGTLGGTFSFANDINNETQIVGLSNLRGDTTAHAFLWQNGVMTDLRTLPGDSSSFAFAINSQGQVVGGSKSASGNFRAFLWQNGVMTDLNTLVPAGSPLDLLAANGINSRGEVTGIALQLSTGLAHGFLAMPCDVEHADNEGCENGGAAASRGQTSERPQIALPENVRKMLEQRLGLRNRILGPGSGPTN